MDRLHVFEFEDLRHCPAVLRQGVTAYLRLAVGLTGQARLVAPMLDRVLRASGEGEILDLCSGGGGPVLAVLDALAQGRAGPLPRVTLSDRYPDRESFETLAAESGGRIRFSREPLDAARVPGGVPGVRTLFNALHHFRAPADAALLAAAADARRPLAAFEFVRRGPVPLLGVLISPLLALLLMPFARPRRLSILAFTYLLPLIPLMIAWDGLASVLRVHSLAELRSLASAAERGDYGFEVGRTRHRFLPIDVTYLIGTPR